MSQETIRKLATRAANALMGEASPAQIAIVAAELAPFGALLEAAERAEREIIWLSLQAFPSRTQEMAIQNSPAIQALRAALSDIQKG